MRWVTGLSVAIIAGLFLYLGSALISMGRLVEAARAGNGAEVVERTDMIRLRHSLVDQIIAAYLERIGKREKPLGRMLAQTYGATIADAMLRKMLTTENLTKLLQTGTVAGSDAPTSLAPTILSIDASNVWDVLVRLSWIKPVEFSIRTSSTADRATYSAVSFHFEGSDWKLSGISLPRNIIQQLAEALPVK